MTDRSLLITRLNAIAAFVDELPDGVKTPSLSFDASTLTFGFWFTDDIAVKVRDTARAIGGRWHKNDPTKSEIDATYYLLTNERRLDGGVKIIIQCDRDEVCEKVQVGTKTVRVEAKPAVDEHDEEQPVFEYECRPLNAAANAITLDTELAELTA